MIESINSVFTPDNVMYIMRGFANTVLLAAVSIFFSIVIGTVLGIIRSYGNFFLRKLAGFYVEIFRNTPNLLHCRSSTNRFQPYLFCLCAFHLSNDGRDCARRPKLYS